MAAGTEGRYTRRGMQCAAFGRDCAVRRQECGEWVNVKDKQPALWDVHDGVMTVNKTGWQH